MPLVLATGLVSALSVGVVDHVVQIVTIKGDEHVDALSGSGAAASHPNAIGNGEGIAGLRVHVPGDDRADLAI